ncbi:MAG TPA: glycogen synthase GlgA, partial [Burkholderiales bacterium]
PLTKTGGLGDVAGALPAALRRIGIDVRVLLPAYGALPGRVLAEVELLGRKARILESRLPTGVPLYLLDCPELYIRNGGPYQTGEGEDWPDNALRFGLLSRVAALLGGADTPLAWRPDVVHCNDWPTALAPVYLQREPGAAASLLTVHNLAFQGLFEADALDGLELPRSDFSVDKLEFYGRLSFLKGGLACAGAISTVSPTYAAEIQGDAQGCGLDGLLRRRSADLSGILNGIDTRVWDPAGDALIASNYDASTLEVKAANKAALQRRAELRVDPSVPLLGMVGRLTHQKGIDLVVAAAKELLELPAQLVVLGKGDRAQEQALTVLAARYPGQVAVATGFNEELAHLIEAGADVFLMPSRFEPCGLSQMYSQRYGTPPVARATGGLTDTIADGETGFLFEGAERAALVQAVRRAVAAWRDQARWRKIQRAGMARDFSWSEAARRYADLYLRLRLARRQPA